MQTNGKKWDRRLQRARELAETYPFAREILVFYAQLTAFQKSAYFQFPFAPFTGNNGQNPLPAKLADADLARLLPRWRPFLKMLEGAAPAALAEFARGLKASSPASVSALLRAAWPANRHAPIETIDVGAPLVGAQSGATTRVAPTIENFCAQAFLQPYAEFLADHGRAPASPVRGSTCPYCGSPPLVGVLRPEGEGAKRSLVCSFCRTEWDYLRLACPACGERRDEILCVYITPKFPSVRVEACGTCRAYILTVDLTKNGLAIPEVDELGAIPLTLWADENGYQKATGGVLSF